jgi:pimeloyl-ACP methyl ester carboxylesterase
MPELFVDVTPEIEAELAEFGYFILDYDDYTRPLKITQGFLDDLKQDDLFNIYQPGDVSVHMIHGDEDETIAVSAAKEFAEKFSIPITIVRGEGHGLASEEAVHQVLNEATAFFK